MIEAQGLTLLGIALANLTDDRAVQLALALDRRRPSALDATLDDVRDRFGSKPPSPARSCSAATRASTMPARSPD